MELILLSLAGFLGLLIVTAAEFLADLITGGERQTAVVLAFPPRTQPSACLPASVNNKAA